MKILHIDPDDIDNPLSGGGPVRTHEIYRRLSARHEITVLTPTFEGSTSELIRDGVRYLRLGRKIGDHGSSHHITFFFSLPRAVRRFDYDLLVEDFMPPMSVTLNPLFAKAPVIGSVQWFFARTLSEQYRLPFHLGERYGLRLYRNLIVLTEMMKQQLLEKFPALNLKVIPNGTDASLFNRPEQASNVPGEYILYLGRIDLAQKGVDLLLQAYARIPDNLKIPLYLAGHSFEQEAVKAMIAKLGLESWVSLPGKVTGDRKKELIDAARFICVPSRTETFGMVITEACACGKSVVLFDQAPMNEVASSACIAVPAFDVDAYAGAMQQLLLESSEQLADRARQCTEWAAQFKWDQIALEQESFYQSVVEGAS